MDSLSSQLEKTTLLYLQKEQRQSINKACRKYFAKKEKYAFEKALEKVELLKKERLEIEKVVDKERSARLYKREEVPTKMAATMQTRFSAKGMNRRGAVATASNKFTPAAAATALLYVQMNPSSDEAAFNVWYDKHAATRLIMPASARAV